MRHLSEEEWVVYYFGEDGPDNSGGWDRRAMQEHIAGCPECAAAGRELAADLARMRSNESEGLRGQEYGEKMWPRVKDSLTPYPKVEKAKANNTGRWVWPRSLQPRWLQSRFVLAGAAVLLAAIAGAAFYSGRLWEERRSPRITVAANEHDGQRIILFVVSDHLDRSQRLLSELNDPDQAAADHGLQARARELLTENRLYRQSSRLDRTGMDGTGPDQKGLNRGGAEEEDASLETILDDLEPALIELANQPGDLDRTKIVQLRKELNTGGLLFEIRVLRSRAHQQEPNNAAPREGTV
ncbi:MAG TPA: hypothetical protein VHZ52_13090 [Acidobacteriaceae bacterium]|jgi:hypothetical protein|nr:hypothetical protein [Acidobacteriaceae bacterium]